MEKVRSIAVIDLKAFYSYVECIDRGLDPWKVPLVVADKERGTNTIILSVTPFLKNKGIPSRLRLKELPKKFDYIYAVPRMERYIEKSSEVVGILLDFFDASDIHVYSIDEAFIDMTSYLSYYKKTPMEMVEFIIGEIRNRTGLQATGGIGDNFFLSKVALDIYAKHEKNGIAEIRNKDVKTKLWPITPLSKIWGIGERTEIKLNKMGIFTVKDLALSNRDYIHSKFGIMGDQLIDHANGIDEADIHEQYIPKENSLTHGQVLFRDFTLKEIPVIIKEMCDDLALRMRNEHKKTSVVSLYIGYSKNSGGFSRQMSLLTATDDNDTLCCALMELLHKYAVDLPIRNVGLNFGKLSDAQSQQLNIFEDEKKQLVNHDLQLTIDEIHNRFGKNMLLRASALTDSSTIIERHNLIGGHRK